jgi:HAE1 family hydrophobic/amphiphilic exporter-1
MRLAVTSDTMSVDDMTVLVEDRDHDILSAVPGVADVQINATATRFFGLISTRRALQAMA